MGKPLSIRLGELAIIFARISSSARVTSNSATVRDALEEARYFIEWTAAEAQPEIAAELVSMQRLITLWLKAWENASQYKEQRTLLYVQAKSWSERVWDFSGLSQ
jgi:hypothetical protein